MDIYCDLEDHENLYTCFVKALDFTSSNTIRVFGEYRGRSNLHVEKIIFHNLRLKKFPRGIGSVFPNIIEISVINCGVETITREDFVDMDNLRMLELSENRIVELPWDVFIDLTKLRMLIIAGNLVTYIHPKTFEPLTKLDWLDLSDNTNINHEWTDLDAKAYRRKHAINKIVSKCKPSKEMLEKARKEMSTGKVYDLAL